MHPTVNGIEFSENKERLKVVMPVRRNWFLFGLFTVMLLGWIAMFIVGIVFMIRDVAFSGERFAFVFTIMLLVFLIILYYLGRILWRQWQYYTADREILFINRETLIVRRPVSIFGITNAYDMNHVSPFYVNEKYRCPTFDYGYQHVYYGHSLPEDAAKKLVSYLNGRYFPHYDEDED